MPRLCSESSRSYPGRSVRHAVSNADSALMWQHARVTGQKSAEVIVGAGRRHEVVWRLETSPKEGGLTPPKDRT